MADPAGEVDPMLRRSLKHYLEMDGAYRLTVAGVIESGMITDPNERDRLAALREAHESALSAHIEVVSRLGWP
jgi:hypothetical protein